MALIHVKQSTDIMIKKLVETPSGLVYTTDRFTVFRGETFRVPNVVNNSIIFSDGVALDVSPDIYEVLPEPGSDEYSSQGPHCCGK